MSVLCEIYGIIH